MKQIGTMRCPVGAIVTFAEGKAEILDESVRCPGSGPVFEDGASAAHTLYIRCSSCCEKPAEPKEPAQAELDKAMEPEALATAYVLQQKARSDYEAQRKAWDRLAPPSYIVMNAAIWKQYATMEVPA